MRLLFVKLKHIGDALLMTPTLVAARSALPQALIWVVVRRGAAEILSGCPGIDRVLTASAPEPHRRSWRSPWHEWKLISQLRAQHFDHAFELTDGDRGRWLTFLSGARHCYASRETRHLNWFWRSRFELVEGFDWRDAHRVEKDYRTVRAILPLEDPIPPLAFEKRFTMPASPFADWKDFTVFHPATRWKRKEWPFEKWIELGRRLLTRVSRILISCGPEVEEIAAAQRMAEALGSGASSTEGRLAWNQLAAILYQARLFVGVDTAAMHLAAACQTPIVALFGPSIESEWRPWKADHILLTEAGSPEERSPMPPSQRTTAGIGVEQAVEACELMLGKYPR